MRNHSHIITGSCSVVVGGAALAAMSMYSDSSNPVIAGVGSMSAGLNNFLTYDPTLPFWLFAVISAVLFYIGLLLPDIDTPTSTLGRYIHLPLGHRTWTHAVWAVIIFAGLGLYFKPLLWLGIGYFLHLLWDSPSKQGVCWLYPLSKYKTFDGDARVKEGHYTYLYKTGGISEYIVVGVMAAITVGVVIACGYHGLLPFVV